MSSARFLQSPSSRPMVPLALFAVGLAGCGGSHPAKHHHDHHAPRPHAVARVAPPAPSSATTFRTGPTTIKHVAFGHTTTLRTADTTLEVSVDRVMAPLTIGRYASTDPGQRLVGVRITLRNTGRAVYDGSAFADATARTATGLELTHDVAVDGPCNGDPLDALGPGETRRGCFIFKTGLGQLPHLVRFSPDGGYGADAAEWAVPLGTPGIARYPAAVRARLVRGCARHGSTGRCTCVIDELRRSISYGDFISMQPEFADHYTPERWSAAASAARLRCGRPAGEAPAAAGRIA